MKFLLTLFLSSASAITHHFHTTEAASFARTVRPGPTMLQQQKLMPKYPRCAACSDTHPRRCRTHHYKIVVKQV